MDPSVEERRNARKRRRRDQARQEILEAARALLDREGAGRLTMDQVAAAVGVTKPAIYYYFPSRQALLQALVRQALEEEMEVLLAAIEDASSGAEALGDVARALVEHYATRMEDFRLVYLHPQVFGAEPFGLDAEGVQEVVHPVTFPFYDRLEQKLLEDEERGLLAPGAHPRRLALLAQTAALGYVTLKGVAEASGDPLRHSDQAMVEELRRALYFAARGANPQKGAQ